MGLLPLRCKPASCDACSSALLPCCPTAAACALLLQHLLLKLPAPSPTTTPTSLAFSPQLPAGRTYRYWRGEAPLFPFGFGLSYTAFSLGNASVEAVQATPAEGDGTSAPEADQGDPTAISATILVTNSGDVAADTSVLLFLSYIGPELDNGEDSSTAVVFAEELASLPTAFLSPSGCAWNSTETDLVQRLAAYGRTGELAPGAGQELTFTLQLGQGSTSSWAGFGDPAPPCGAYALRFGVDQPEAAVVVLD